MASVQFVNVVGTEGDERLRGGGRDDLIEGAGGDDTLLGRGGDDTLAGGQGDDVLIGGLGFDELRGGDGFDIASYADAEIAASIFLEGSTGGAAFGDTYAGVEGFDLTADDDFFEGGALTDGVHVWGRLGSDRLGGTDGDDTLNGGEGGDFILGGGGRDLVSFADASAGVFLQLGASETNSGEAQGDHYTEVEGFILTDHADTFIGAFVEAQMNWEVRGGGGGDSLQGFSGQDTISGDNGHDTITGQLGADSLSGGQGRDLIQGGAGADTLAGGVDADRFVYISRTESNTTNGVDRITDFDAGEGDRIDVSAIDARFEKDGNQRFHFVEAFTGRSGEATLTVEGDLTVFRADTNGDGAADMVIEIEGVVSEDAGWVL